MTIHLAGIPIRDASVLELVRLVDDEHLELRLRYAVANETRILALEIDERDTIIRSLDDPEGALAELRGVLLRERTHRQAEGL